MTNRFTQALLHVKHTSFIVDLLLIYLSLDVDSAPYYIFNNNMYVAVEVRC